MIYLSVNATKNQVDIVVTCPASMIGIVTSCLPCPRMLDTYVYSASSRQHGYCTSSTSKERLLLRGKRF